MKVYTQSSCEKDDAWQRSMGIDSLKRGRDQPFYHTILSEGPERCEYSPFAIFPIYLYTAFHLLVLSSLPLLPYS